MRERTMEKKNAVQNPLIENPGTMLPANRIRSAFTTKEKRPKVTMLIGSVKIKISGFKKTLMRPSTTANTTAPKRVTVTPGKRYAEIRIARAERIQ
jgi:hypothetical protein